MPYLGLGLIVILAIIIMDFIDGTLMDLWDEHSTKVIIIYIGTFIIWPLPALYYSFILWDKYGRGLVKLMAKRYHYYRG